VTLVADDARAEDFRNSDVATEEGVNSSDSVVGHNTDLEIDCMGPVDASLALAIREYEVIRDFLGSNLIMWDGTDLTSSKDFVSEYVFSNDSTVTVLLDPSYQDLSVWQLGMQVAYMWHEPVYWMNSWD
jgi:hypothetical protein